MSNIIDEVHNEILRLRNIETALPQLVPKVDYDTLHKYIFEEKLTSNKIKENSIKELKDLKVEIIRSLAHNYGIKRYYEKPKYQLIAEIKEMKKKIKEKESTPKLKPKNYSLVPTKEEIEEVLKELNNGEKYA